MFHGSIVALLTPMQENGDIDYPCLRELVKWHITQGTDAILVMGTTGEPATLKAEEQENVIKAVVEQALGHRAIKYVPVIAGTGTNCTQSTIEKTRRAMEIGVDACLLVTPYYNCPTQEGLFQHYRTVAEKVPIPQILYNIPKRTGVDLLPETVTRLAGITNIVGIKEGQPERAKEIIKLCGTNIDVYSGDDSTALEILRLGGKGVISVVANLLPKVMHDFYEATKPAESEIDWNKAEEKDQQLQALYKSLFIETNPIPVKWLAAARQLIPASHLRLPLTTLSSAHQIALKPILNFLESLI
ncbi:MAG: 4-hydroxy-tetrahydrodipicolinate synthase [Rickettsiella sp.]|nr:4-hydroxy-tetrahydrodipicolinate synthase [Rickettsiella sp.]